MKVTSIAFVGLAASALGACAASQSHPLSVSATEGRALFTSIATCAADRKVEAVQHPDSVNVRATAGAWAQFMAQGSQFNLVVVVDDSTGGPQAMQERAAAAKKTGDEIFACAVAAGPKAGPIVASATLAPSSSPAAPAPATVAAAPTAAATTTPAATPPAPAASSTATTSTSASATGTGKNPMDGFGRALGGAFGAMSDCTKLTACRTQLSGEVCLAADKKCLDAINSGDSGGPAGCSANLARVREAAERFKRRPDWKLPDVCK